MGISIPQLLIILLIVALLFGTKKLRGIGSDLGSALKGFRNAIKDEDPDTTSQTTSEEETDNIIDSKPQEKEASAQKQEEQV